MAHRSTFFKEDCHMFRTLYALVAVALLLAAAQPLAQSATSRTRSASAGAAKPAGPVNLNSATLEDLATLPGIGEKTAAKILEYREKNGPFKKVEELMNVQGIGEKSFLKLKPQITVAAAPPSAASQK